MILSITHIVYLQSFAKPLGANLILAQLQTYYCATHVLFPKILCLLSDSIKGVALFDVFGCEGCGLNYDNP